MKKKQLKFPSVISEAWGSVGQDLVAQGWPNVLDLSVNKISIIHVKLYWKRLYSGKQNSIFHEVIEIDDFSID